jgi:hypothetical protein
MDCEPIAGGITINMTRSCFRRAEISMSATLLLSAIMLLDVIMLLSVIFKLFRHPQKIVATIFLRPKKISR